MTLLRWSLIFLIIAGIAALFGFTNLAGDAAGIAKVLFFIFLAVFATLGLLGVTVFKKIT